MSKQNLMHFIFKLTANLLPELDNFHVYSQQDVVAIVQKSSIQISTV